MEFCELLGHHTIGFICPSQISKKNILSNPQSVTTYLIRALTDDSKKTFILAPYLDKSEIHNYCSCLHNLLLHSFYIYQILIIVLMKMCSDHWVLLVICTPPRGNAVYIYVLDPKAYKKELEIKTQINT
jgi:hypothetical protein